MPSFEIEQYEIHVMRYRVEAQSEAEAISKLLRGYALPVDESLEFVEVCEDRGLPADENPQLVDGLRALEIAVDDVIPSIRRVVRMDQRG